MASSHNNNAEQIVVFGSPAVVEGHLSVMSTAASIFLMFLLPFRRFHFSPRRRAFLLSVGLFVCTLLVFFFIGFINQIREEMLTEVDIDEVSTIAWPSVAICQLGVDGYQWGVPVVLPHFAGRSPTPNVLFASTGSLRFENDDFYIAGLDTCYLIDSLPESWDAQNVMDSVDIYLPCIGPCNISLGLLVSSSIRGAVDRFDLTVVRPGDITSGVLSRAVLITQPDDYFAGPFNRQRKVLYAYARQANHGTIPDGSVFFTMSFLNMMQQTTKIRVKNAVDVLADLGGIIGLIDFCLSFLLMGMTLLVYVRALSRGEIRDERDPRRKSLLASLRERARRSRRRQRRRNPYEFPKEHLVDEESAVGVSALDAIERDDARSYDESTDAANVYVNEDDDVAGRGSDVELLSVAHRDSGGPPRYSEDSSRSAYVCSDEEEEDQDSSVV
jgi:hypothetical protein